MGDLIELLMACDTGIGWWSRVCQMDLLLRLSTRIVYCRSVGRRHIST